MSKHNDLGETGFSWGGEKTSDSEEKETAACTRGGPRRGIVRVRATGCVMHV